MPKENSAQPVAASVARAVHEAVFDQIAADGNVIVVDVGQDGVHLLFGIVCFGAELFRDFAEDNDLLLFFFGENAELERVERREDGRKDFFGFRLCDLIAFVCLFAPP